jgi:hypothetical protein
MKNKFSIAMSLAVIVAMLLTSLALAAELVTAEVTGTGNDVTVTQGTSVTSSINLSATGAISCAITSGSPSTATVDTSYSLNSSGALTTGSPSSAFQFYSDGVVQGNPQANNCGVTWDTGSTPYSVTATFSAAATTPIGNYTVTLQDSSAGTTDTADVTNPSVSGGKLGDTIPTTITVHVVAPVVTDSTPPVITKTIMGTLGNNGWYTSNVSVDWTVSDPESSFTTVGCADTTISSDTSGTTSSCSATSAGGTSSDSVTIKRDATAPTSVSGAPDRAPDNGTWYNNAVNVVFTGTDAPSGIASCTSTNYSGPDGAGVTVSGSCTDNAGNSSTTVASSAFDYDNTAPTAALSVTAGTAGANGWYTSNVTVSTSGADSVSGVTCSDDQYLTTETAGTEFNGSCTNGAGLSTDAAPLTVKLDKTGPSASLSAAGTLGDNNWYTSNVTISTSGSDSISDPTTCTADQSQTTDTASATFNGSCTNDAGLSTDAASLTIKRDATAPTSISFVGGPDAGGSYYFGSVPSAPTCTADGAISGLASCVVSGYATTVGSQTMTATAKDNAGNVGTASRSYTVLAWTLTGFYAPVDMNSVYNIVKGGSTVPLKFEVFAGATELTATSAIKSFVQTKIACDGSSPTDEIEVVTTGGTSLRYDATAGQFIQNWQTPKQPGTCYRVTMTTQDGSFLTAFFKLK